MRTALFFSLMLGVFLIGTAWGENPQRNITGKDGAPMVVVPGGVFTMGSEDDDIKEFAPVHEVHVDSFYMDVFEVTNKLFAEFLNEVKPSEEKDDKRWNWLVLRSDLSDEERKYWWPTEIVYEEGEYKAFRGFESYPVMTVSWDAADAYCKWAGERLPTEAEWERAARGGLEQMRFPWGNEIPTTGIVYARRWIDNLAPPPTQPVGNYHPNAFGIFDMAGNVWEWCYDWFAMDYYKKSPEKNPRGPESGEEKVLRGGSWVSSSNDLRVGTRHSEPPFIIDDGIGFRCVMDAKLKVK